MKKLEDILKNLVLPIKLPTDVFILFGKKRKIPDFEIIFNQELPELNSFLEPNGTVRTSQQNVYLFPLLEDGHLAITIIEQSIVEIIYISASQPVPESVRKLMKRSKE